MAKYVVELEYTVPDLDAPEELRRPERESLLNWRRHRSSIMVLRFVGNA